MKLVDLPKLLKTDDRVVRMEATLQTTANNMGGRDAILKFAYAESGLYFWAEHYHNFVLAFHRYDDELFTDADSYLEAITPVKTDRRAWVEAIRERLDNAFRRARLLEGQPVGVRTMDGSTFPGFIKNIDTNDDSIVVTYDEGRQATVRLKRTKLGNSYQGRNGITVTLGGQNTQFSGQR